MKLNISAVSNIGSVRSNNEDMILVVDQLLRDSSYETVLTSELKNCWIAVADGMGGHNAGEIASEFVLREMAEFVATMPANLDSEDLKTMITALVKDIHIRLNELGTSQESSSGLGCTFNGILIYGNDFFSINIGDSRLYRYRGNFLAQLTKDHTLRNMLNNPLIPANQIANSFGGGIANIFLDFEKLTERIFPNDKLILCSDGLNGELTDEEIESAIGQNFSCSELVNQANEKGGRDNISCIMITVDGENQILLKPK
jgi:serine/threonine protein phosphatase PrpC